MKIKTYTTAGVAAKIEVDNRFKNFVNDSLNRHLAGDWGETCQEDAELNNSDPLNAMSSYIYDDGLTKIWVKRENDIIIVLFPSEY